MDKKKKYSFLDNVQIDIFRGDQRVNFLSYVSKIGSGIILTNENSLINVGAIDRMHFGRVGPESVNLSEGTGNREVLSIIRAMKSRKDCSFFPGTLLVDVGGYSIPAMPIFEHGEMTQLRIKQTSVPYVDDYHTLAKKFLGDDYDPNARYGEVSFMEPTKGLKKKVNEEVEGMKISESIEIDGLNILPVICNELGQVASSGKNNIPYDGIVHSANAWCDSESKALAWAEKCFYRMKNHGRITLPFVYAVAHLGGREDFSGKYLYDGKALKKIY